MAKKTIMIPESEGGSPIPIEIEKNLIIVGANGSGKSRLGLRIEQLNSPLKPTKRIAAQRSLAISGSVSLEEPDTAERNYINSFPNQAIYQPQEDFDKVLIYLNAQESKLNAAIVQRLKEGKKDFIPEPSVKEQVMEVWRFIFPYRELDLTNSQITGAQDSTKYPGYELSDGEKVGLYLISYVLLALENSILIIDEPEIHLHKDLMVRLWNILEKYRSDCTFVYITHDLDFAANKSSSVKIWTQKYFQGVWTWEIIKPNENLPGNLYLELLGSREPVIFIEGDKGSLDYRLYQSYWNNLTIIPIESYQRVIDTVKSLNCIKNHYYKEVFGLIDRDSRPDGQLDEFEKYNIFSLPVSEIENLFLVPELIQLVCDHMSQTDKKEAIIDAIRQMYIRDKSKIKFDVFKYRGFRIFNETFGKVKDEALFEKFKQIFVKYLDTEYQMLKMPEDDCDFLEILKVYPNKGLLNRVQSIIGLTNDTYTSLVLGFLQSEKRSEVVEILDKYMPKIQPTP